MNLVSALLSGIAGAANGWAEVYIRGSSTRATIYGDFEASTSNSSGDDIDLDAYGAVEIYVNQLVDIVAKSPDGTVIRSWTDGYASGNVEVISPAFTGHDYISGAAAVSKPTTLQAVLDLWVTNAGAPDWKVGIGGSNTTLSNAFGTLTGLVFNVRSPQFGATGDGITNDQSAIQAALAAAVAAGGGTVFFPKGTYLISTAIEWDHKVSIQGVGGGLSVITSNSAVNGRIITFTSGTAQTAPISISGMAFASTQTNTGSQLYATVAVNLVVEKCWLGASSGATGILANFTSGATKVVFRDCLFSVNGSSTYVATTGPLAYTCYDRCRFVTTGTSAPFDLLRVQGTRDVVTNCVFDITSVTSAGSYVGIQMANSGSLAVTDCSFVSLAQPFAQCMALLGGSSAVTATGNDFGSQVSNTWYSVAGTLGSGSSLQLRGDENLTSSTAPVITGAVAVSCMFSTTTIPTWTMPAGLFPGQKLVVMVENTSGAGWASMGTFTGATTTTTGNPAVANGTSHVIEFLWSDLSAPGTYVWRSIQVT